MIGLHVRGRLGLALLVSALAAGCQDTPAGGASTAEPPRLKHVPPAPDADVLALLAPWQVGTEVQGYKIAAIYGVVDGSIWVLLKNGQTLVHLEIVRSGEGPPPPFSAPPYFVYLSARAGASEGLLALAESAGAILTANKARPVPAGLQTFHRGGHLPDLP